MRRTKNRLSSLGEEGIMSNSYESTNRWMLFIKWILLNMAGVGVAYLGASLVNLPENESLYYVFITVIWFLMGAVIGGFQWLVLRHWLENPISWIIVVGLGFVIAAHVSIPIILWDMYYNLNLPYELGRPFQLDEVIFGAVFGTIMGGVQWIVLRRYFGQAGWWIAGSFAGWTLARLVGELIPFDWSWSGTGILYEAVNNLIVAVVTGFVLVRILNRSQAGRRGDARS